MAGFPKFQLRKNLYLIGQNMSVHDLNSLKFLCTYQDVPKRQLEKIETAFELFCALESINKLGYDNDAVLRELLRSRSREHLLNKYPLRQDPNDDLATDQGGVTPSSGEQIKLAHFLDEKISNSLSSQDFKDIACFLFDPEVSSYSYVDIERMSSANDIFQRLIASKIIGPSNLSALYQVLEVIGRNDLCQKIYEYNPQDVHVAALRRKKLSGLPLSSASPLPSMPISRTSSDTMSSSSSYCPSELVSPFSAKEFPSPMEHNSSSYSGTSASVDHGKRQQPSAPPQPAQPMEYELSPVMGPVHQPQHQPSPVLAQVYQPRHQSSPMFGPVYQPRHQSSPVSGPMYQSQHQPQPVLLGKPVTHGTNYVGVPPVGDTGPSISSHELANNQQPCPHPIQQQAEVMQESYHPLQNPNHFQPGNLPPGSRMDHHMQATEPSHNPRINDLQAENQDLKDIAAQQFQLIQELMQDKQPNNKKEKAAVGSEVPRYRMNSKPHGIALVIGNEVFQPNRKRSGLMLGSRTGCKSDVFNFRSCFGHLRYDVRDRMNLSAQEIVKQINDVAKIDHSKYDSFVFCISTHGEDNNYIFGSDSERVNVYNLIGQMQACESLRGKPKLFFIQACRANAVDGVFSDGSPPVKPIINQDADVAIFWATTRSSSAYRSPRDGSWFVAAMHKTFVSHADRMNLVSMMYLVTDVVANMEGTDRESREKAKQCVEISLQMRGEVHFLSS